MMFKTMLLITYLLFLGAFLLPGIASLKHRRDTFGLPSISLFFFVTGKAAVGLSVFFPLLQLFAGGPAVSQVKWAALLAFASGGVLFLMAIRDLGEDALKFGLPRQGDRTTLKTLGLYRFSRNPLYVSLYLMMAASQLLHASLLNLGAALFAVAVHHRIVLAEERFLEKRFKEKWTEYKKKVRRYL